MRKIIIPFILLGAVTLQFLCANDDRAPIRYNYLSKPDVQKFIQVMHTRYGFKQSYLKKVFTRAKLDRDTLSRYTGKFKKNSTVGSWERFKLHIVNNKSFKEAKEFKKHYYTTLHKAAQRYKVDVDYIVGFIGVESHYGKYTGDYRVLDALATLAFHPNRMQRFFKSELKHLFLFARENNYDITKLEGSFAGAMGCVQQLPSVARKFSFDFDGDGASIWDMEDCIGSIAKFMHEKGWKQGKKVAVKANYSHKRFSRLKTGYRHSYSLKKLKHLGITPKQPFPYKKAMLIKLHNTTHDELWLCAPNFRVLTAYNASSNYGMAIHKIARSLK